MKKFLFAYLRFWAKKYLNRVKPQIIAVTGSVGKTSTKNAIFEVLRVKYGGQVRKSEGNLNNETGVPLAILGITKSPSNPLGWLPVLVSCKLKSLFGKKVQILILELAADKPDDIKYLTTFIKPNIAVLTSIGPAHMAAFGNIEKIIAEKTQLLKALPKNGWAVLNIDDENINKISLSDEYEEKTFGISKKADVIAQNIVTGIENYRPETTFQIVAGKNKFLAISATLGRQTNIYPALAAAVVGKILSITNEQIINGLKNIRAEKHRLEVVRGKNGSIIIDDTYNANPLSMKAALETLKILPAKRKIAVLGEMLELGEISENAHQIIGEYAREVAEMVITIGENAKKYHADQAGKNFPNKKEATDFLLAEVKEGDMILIKASRAVRLEEVVEALKNNS